MFNVITRAKSVFWLSLLLSLAACSEGVDNKKTGCDALVTQTRAMCLDVIRSGLNVSCREYLMAVKMAKKQASGNLFDVGESNQSTADSFCNTYVGKLREDVEEQADSMAAAGSAGPKCTALADNFEQTCLSHLGKDDLSRGCNQVASSLMQSGAMGQLPPEQRCSMASMHLPDN